MTNQNLLPFLKMHGLGNDFVIIDARGNGFNPSSDFLKAIGNRRRGIGFDQCIILRPPVSPDADIYMDMYNSDGSTVRACGNASRCVASLLFKELGRIACVIETVAGLLAATQENSGLVAIDFGQPLLQWDQIPLAYAADTLHLPLKAPGFDAPCGVNMGNPHAVFFVPSVDAVDVAGVGAVAEHDALFPERCNIEFAQILSPHHIRMRVWERGAGITEACGSGACATLVAAVRRGLCARRATLSLDGGDLDIEWRENNHVFMIGAARFSYSGVVATDFGRDAS